MFSSIREREEEGAARGGKLSSAAYENIPHSAINFHVAGDFLATFEDALVLCLC